MALVEDYSIRMRWALNDEMKGRMQSRHQKAIFLPARNPLQWKVRDFQNARKPPSVQNVSLSMHSPRRLRRLRRDFFAIRTRLEKKDTRFITPASAGIYSVAHPLSHKGLSSWKFLCQNSPCLGSRGAALKPADLQKKMCYKTLRLSRCVAVYTVENIAGIGGQSSISPVS